MIFLKLAQKVVVQHQGAHGWESETVYEPVFVAADHIYQYVFRRADSPENDLRRAH